ncbi:hypothetical protein [Solemya elarraichensis gill symbiont]|uniref:hypothetical protein n=1 Tax=Solemya elarraichensis gill symbiont TaxID=1918949 RepID=UPI0014289DDA|nr:hypothetical protein [Solemya elarraichensis gill symbiont]
MKKVILSLVASGLSMPAVALPVVGLHAAPASLMTTDAMIALAGIATLAGVVTYRLVKR